MNDFTLAKRPKEQTGPDLKLQKRTPTPTPTIKEEPTSSPPGCQIEEVEDVKSDPFETTFEPGFFTESDDSSIMSEYHPTSDEDDPIMAEYDVYMTPEHADQIYILQYPNRNATQPYNARSGVVPGDMRLKPQTGYLELEMLQNYHSNFDLHKAIKWGATLEAVEKSTAKSSFGLASGLPDTRTKVPRNRPIQAPDQADLEARARNLISNQNRSQYEDQLMRKQVLGGQIQRHNTDAVGDSPHYFLGAFRGNQLHLTTVSGTAQLRPQHHHLDAVDLQKASARRAAAAADNDQPAVERGILPTFKQENEGSTALAKGSLKPDEALRAGLKAAEEEAWVGMDYVDEGQQEAFDAFYQRCFVSEELCAGQEGGVREWCTDMEGWDWLGAVGKVRKGMRRRRGKRATAKDGGLIEVDQEMDEATGDEVEQVEDAVMGGT